VRLRELVARAKRHGIECEAPNSGSHYKFRRREDGKVYPVPAHNGMKTEIRDIYIAGFCRCFGLHRDQLVDDG
jgi:hypothetical protein